MVDLRGPLRNGAALSPPMKSVSVLASSSEARIMYRQPWSVFGYWSVSSEDQMEHVRSVPLQSVENAEQFDLEVQGGIRRD